MACLQLGGVNKFIFQVRSALTFKISIERFLATNCSFTKNIHIIIQSEFFFLFLDVGIEILRHSEHEHKEAGDVIMKQGETGDK